MTRDGPRIKVQRAKKHIYELDAEIAEFWRRNPYSVVTEEETDTGDKVWRVKVRIQPPLRWALIVGDAVHNLRSSLDLLVNQLVIAEGRFEPSDKTAFPIGWTAEDYKTKAARVTKGISEVAEEMIAALKPYKGGNEALWRLHRLDILDKHRLLVTVGAAHKNVIMPMASRDWLGGAFNDLRLSIVPEDREFPLKDSDEIFRVAKAAREQGDEQYDDTQFTFEIALNEPGIIEGEAVLPALHELANLVQGIVTAFEPLLP